MKKSLLIGALALTVTQTGCGVQTAEENDVTPYDTSAENKNAGDNYFGLGPVSDYFSNRNQDAGNSYDGNRTPEYSNMGTKNFNYGHDRDMIRHTISEKDHFTPGSVRFAGGKAVVGAKYKGPDAAYDRQVKELKDTLQSQMVRYNIVLRVKR
ncbi:hypothetical protein [Tuberibacillus sp. Marseille-P3662]|uniref:hypothetical protein n=1 Tax=Tuberibacillus sp. Marseille-P3662 TaxID=1965358 RepID=UPI000A1C8EF5|nr:hypothetical protein [Tuberibacillus sp. Marseille-P3662]